MSELRRTYTTVDARDRILEGALAVFARRGFDGAKTREIAKEAGVSPALIHHHFNDKETLWDLVGERISDEFVEFVSVALENEQGQPEDVRAVVERYLRYWRTHPRALRFHIWRLMGAPEHERRRRSQQLNSIYVPFFKKAQENGAIRADIPAGLAMITLGGLIQFYLNSDQEIDDALAVTGDAPLDDDHLLDYLCSLIEPHQAPNGS